MLYFLIFSSIMFPPQIMLISLFQILVQYGLYNSLARAHAGLRRDPAAADDLPPRTFFARIPTDLFDAARMDGYSDWEMFWRVRCPMALPAVATTVILNFITSGTSSSTRWCSSPTKNRTLPLGIQRFMGDQYQDIGMIATGLMIAILPVMILYVFLSERLIQGMTAGAVK